MSSAAVVIGALRVKIVTDGTEIADFWREIESAFLFYFSIGLTKINCYIIQTNNIVDISV